MNTLNLIKKQIDKASAIHDAQISHTAYRGVKYDVHCDLKGLTKILMVLFATVDALT